MVWKVPVTLGTFRQEWDLCGHTYSPGPRPPAASGPLCPHAYPSGLPTSSSHTPSPSAFQRALLAQVTLIICARVAWERTGLYLRTLYEIHSGLLVLWQLDESCPEEIGHVRTSLNNCSTEHRDKHLKTWKAYSAHFLRFKSALFEEANLEREFKCPNATFIKLLSLYLLL